MPVSPTRAHRIKILDCINTNYSHFDALGSPVSEFFVFGTIFVNAHRAGLHSARHLKDGSFSSFIIVVMNPIRSFALVATYKPIFTDFWFLVKFRRHLDD